MGKIMKSIIYMWEIRMAKKAEGFYDEIFKYALWIILFALGLFIIITLLKKMGVF